MKLKHTILLIAMSMLFTATFAQKSVNGYKAAPKKQMKCYVYTDTAMVKLTLEQAKAWADTLPLLIFCDDLKTYKLHQFDFTLITANPMQAQEFGKGNGGIPLLARKAINNLKAKDAVILKNATYLGVDGKEQALPVISFSIVE